MLIEVINLLLAICDFEGGDFSDDYFDGPLFENWCCYLLLHGYDSLEIRLCAGVFCVNDFHKVLKQLMIQLPNMHQALMLSCAKILLNSSAALTQDITQIITDAGDIHRVLSDSPFCYDNVLDNVLNEISGLAMDIAYNTGEYYQDLVNALLPLDKAVSYHSSYGHCYLQDYGRAEIKRLMVKQEHDIQQAYATMFSEVMNALASYKIVQQPNGTKLSCIFNDHPRIL